MKVGLGIYSPASPAMAIGPIDTALGLAALGVEVTIFAEAGIPLPPRARPLADRVVRLEPAVRELPPRARDALFVAGRLGLGRRWAAALRKHPVDVVHAFSPGTTAPLPAGLPVVVQSWYHPARATLRRRLRREAAYGTGGVGGSLPAPVRGAVQVSAHLAQQLQVHTSDVLGHRRADLLVTPTPSAARFFTERGHRAVCIPPCIAMAESVADRAPGEAFRVAFCAHPLDRPWKGLRYLLEALAIVAPAGPLELSLVGDWAQRPDTLLAEVEQAGVRVEVLGRVDRDVYLDRLATRTDLLVAPALWEEWGYSLFEGLSRGVPVVAFDLYPYSETLGSDVGMLVPARNALRLARSIEDARAGRLPARADVLEAARGRWGAEEIAARLLSAYGGVIVRRKPSG